MAPEGATGPPGRTLSTVVLGFALVVSLTLGTTGVALATVQDQDSGLTICDRDAATFVSVYNDQSESIPGLVTGRVKDSQIHLQVFGAGGGNYTLDTDAQSQVTEYSDGKPSDANLRIETDCATFRNITDSANPGATFRTAYRTGDVRIIGLGVVNWLFFEALKTLTDPVSLVVILFFVLLIVGYVVYRRFAIYYRGDDDEDEEPVEPVADAGEGDGDGSPAASASGGDVSPGPTSGGSVPGPADGDGASGPTTGGSAPGPTDRDGTPGPVDGDGAPGPAEGAGSGPGDRE